MRKQSKGINKRLKNWINNRLFKTLNAEEWEIESILYIYNNEKESNIRGRSQQSLDFSRWDAEYKHTHARIARGDNDESI